MSRLMFLLRETLVYAYLCGLYECLRYGPGLGRTHETNADWNFWYDTGMNHADFICGRTS